MFYIAPVQAGKVTFCKTEIVDGIQQVGFANTVFTANTYNSFPEVK